MNERTNGKKLSKTLRTLALSDNAAVKELSVYDADIRMAESKMNEMEFALYKLNGTERALIENSQ